MKNRSKLPYLAVLSGLFFCLAASHAEVVLINFEDQDIQTTNQLVIDNPNLVVTISRSQGAAFEIKNPNAASFGQRTLVSVTNAVDLQKQFIADFSVPVNAVTFEVGDHGGAFPEFDRLDVTAYADNGGMGEMLQTQTTTCCAEPGFSSGSITVSAQGIKSIVFIGGSPFAPNSVFYDNFSVAFDKPVVDLDNDGVPDDVDTCKNSIMSATVVIDGCNSETPNITWSDSGCTTSDYVMACSKNAKNHGHFVKCVNEFSKSLQDYAFVSGDQKDQLQSCAAQAKLP